MARTLLVTGANGQLGRAVVKDLLARGAGRIVAGTRDVSNVADLVALGAEARRIDFDDPELTGAFNGVHAALIVSTDDVVTPGRRARQHHNAIRAAEAAGVRRLAYTSLLNPEPGSLVSIAPDHWATEQALEASSLAYAILRNNMYTDLLPSALSPAIGQGTLITGRGDGAVSYVTRADCAAVAAAALAEDHAERRVYDITGPEAIDGDTLAAITAAITGRPLAHQAVPVDAFAAGLEAHGLPAPIARLLASFDASAAAGQLATVSPAVQQLLGRPPTSVRDFLAEHALSLG